eukprot:CAMPEP_0172614122 /NCGR_PEP_ID=MMETSP1068-20121228/49215_1 /TAXON_ID=35684 /ORGANISM="Pseudopedinella elastica, Strain CCMP716" /LENGTH=128 /DNA_ID=CAMNT_0013418821 /DNA_START=296 /DNA_END=679 /DNA_ORIENTATION=+
MSFTASSRSSSLRGLNGRAMSRRDTGVLSPTRTSKQPFRGFSGLILTARPGLASSSAFSILPARVLNAPQLLQASMTTSSATEFADFSEAFIDFTVFLVEASSPPSAAARFVPFFGGILRSWFLVGCV